MKKIISIVSLFALPSLAFADTVRDADSLFALVRSILGNVLPIIVSIAVIWFIYNVFAYAISADEEKKGEAKSRMIWGIVALFVMVSVWGLVGILSKTLNLDPSTPNLQHLLFW